MHLRARGTSSVNVVSMVAAGLWGAAGCYGVIDDGGHFGRASATNGAMAGGRGGEQAGASGSDGTTIGGPGGSLGGGGGGIAWAGAAGAGAGGAGSGAGAGGAVIGGGGGALGGAGAAGASGLTGTAGIAGGAGTSAAGGTGGSAGTPVIWRPAPGTTWQWQLTGTIDESVSAQMFDVDLFDTPASTVAALHAAGRKVVCYVNAGAFEDWRPDAGQFPASVKGKGLEGWPGEVWLDVRQWSVLQPILEARMDLCRSHGFDGIELDNVDGYSNDTGFPLKAADQLTFNRALATSAHARRLSVGLKNDLDQIPDLLSDFDWALNEQCFEYSECGALAPFVTAGKAVFNAEYNLAPSAFCSRAISMGLSSIVKHLELDAYRVACNQ